METIDILESKIKEVLSKRAELELEHRSLVEEVSRLRESVKRLEEERDNNNEKLRGIIEKVEVYLGSSGDYGETS